ncbi:hypothetical protein N0O92_06590 [Alkalihalobacillus sp. MEB130]|uniref:hypothetical protein n=1 Tax=Alkalihalobacillus sp. MEB130 TaxID=2976704 RepID=UPI0028DD5FC3|nr:hypothetical protein [Alkalihalobacillus sp. MEB130]MDT8859895.1 hypothetical protein [Alkalihalobacillus sp. MEB130]
MFLLKETGKLSVLLSYFYSKKQKPQHLDMRKPDIVGEVLVVEDHWLLVDDIYIDVRETSFVNEKNEFICQLHIEEGVEVAVWIEESEVIRTYPALATAQSVQIRKGRDVTHS